MSNPENPKAIWPVRVWRFYRDGFRQMTVGRYLWAMIIIKLFFIFAVMKLFFFPDILSRDYDTDEERSKAVRGSMLAPERVSTSDHPVSAPDSAPLPADSLRLSGL